MREVVDREMGSWVALQRADIVSIKGVVRFPNSFSTSHLELNVQLTAEGRVPHFVVGFGRDKEPFCSPDLIGQVHYQGHGFEHHLTSVVVLDGDARICIPVRAA